MDSWLHANTFTMSHLLIAEELTGLSPQAKHAEKSLLSRRPLYPSSLVVCTIDISNITFLRSTMFFIPLWNVTGGK